ncbi:Zn-ribbon domain-containing OB-fold protein [Actinomadura syzygii]|uniref:Zn-ribbon domain-containing OB-fold protein n=1 Tax=Actinomadura syzygii TaxID=1427538 RepID=A0A5D0U3I1_9ACTN|nr:OB-fold domain-containing protein [Actinomadura syzygii]TYC13191.1 hypothetical protein FXF65_22065 [Actinomadura syzygii]
MTTPEKPIPTVTDENRPFWDGCAAGELRMQRCASCSHVRYPVQPLCPKCLDDSAEWTALSGRGEVFAKVIYQRAFNPAFAADVPYNLVLVQLDEGPRMYGNVVGPADDGIRVGAAVAVCFDEVAEGVSVPRFRLATD